MILAASSYASPVILLRSGVGPAKDLRALGIDVVADLPVGRRLQDHPFFHSLFALAPGHQTMTDAFSAGLWCASTEAQAGELDLGVVAVHLLDGSFSPTGAALLLATAVTRPESRGSSAWPTGTPTPLRSSTTTTSRSPGTAAACWRA